MPGVEVDFWSIASDGKVLVTLNGKGHTLLGEIPGAQVHDPLKDTLSAQYQAHRQQQLFFGTGSKLVLPDAAIFIKLQQKLLDAYFLKLMKDKVIISTGNNQFRITFGKSLKLAGQILRGETQVRKLLRSRVQKSAGTNKNSAAQQPGGAQANTVQARATEAGVNPTQYPIDAEVYAFLRLKSAHESRTTGIISKAILFMATMLISYFAFGLAFSFNSVFILLAVILFHELGHIAAMYAFKYRDLHILFLPLLGAVATGKKENVAVWKQVVIYLMGPMPGIILGLALVILNKDWQAPLVNETATIMLVINYLNLLPIVPLDGGHIVRLTIMERFPTGKLVFLGLSIAAFAAGGVFLSEPVFWVLALVMLAAFPMARMETAVLKILHQQPGNPDALDVPGRLRKVFEALKRPQFSKLNFSEKYNLVKSLSDVILQQRHCSAHTALSLTGVYLAVLLLTPPAILVSTIGFDNATSKLQLTTSDIPAKDWDAEILGTTEPHERFELFIQASQYYSATGELHKSLNYLKQAESMATSLNDEDMFARVYHAYALYFQGRGEYAKAESYLEQAIDIGMKRSDKNYLQIATHFQALASLKYQQQDMKNYESDLITALLFAKKIETPDQRYVIGNILSQLLDLYYQQQQFDTVQVLLEQTLKEFGQKGTVSPSSFVVKFVHQELGWLYIAKGDFNLAIEHFDQAVAMLHRGSNTSQVASTDPMEKTNLLLAKAVAQYMQGNQSLALNELGEVERLVKENNFDSLQQYIETYAPSDNMADSTRDVITGMNLGGVDITGDSSREPARWQMIHDLTQARNQTNTAAAQ